MLLALSPVRFLRHRLLRIVCGYLFVILPHIHCLLGARSPSASAVPAASSMLGTNGRFTGSTVHMICSIDVRMLPLLCVDKAQRGSALPVARREDL